MIGLQCKIAEIGLEIDNLNFEWSAVLGIVGKAQTKRHRWHRTAKLSHTPPRRIAASGITGRTAAHATSPTAHAATHPTATASATTSSTHSAAHASTHATAAATTTATAATTIVTRPAAGPICRRGTDAARERNGRDDPAVEKRARALHRDGARRGFGRSFAIVMAAPLGPAFTAGPKGSQR